MQRSWLEEAAPQRRRTGRDDGCYSVCEDEPAAAFISRVSRCSSKPSRRRDTPASMPRYGDRTSVGAFGRGTCNRPMDATACARLASAGVARVEADPHASLGGRREGDRRLWPRGGGAGLARTPRRKNASSAAQGARQAAGARVALWSAAG
jgi:hypothetical protein